METLNFDNSSYVLFQILSDENKIDFLNQSFNADVLKLSQNIYNKHFKSVIDKTDFTQIGILSYKTEDDRVNIFFHNNYMHVNSNKLKSITHLVKLALQDGNLLIRDYKKKKTGKNKNRYHMRYYRAYLRLNYGNLLYPINYN